jgi:hypothetical protein
MEYQMTARPCRHGKTGSCAPSIPRSGSGGSTRLGGGVESREGHFAMCFGLSDAKKSGVAGVGWRDLLKSDVKSVGLDGGRRTRGAELSSFDGPRAAESGYCSRVPF